MLLQNTVAPAWHHPGMFEQIVLPLESAPAPSDSTQPPWVLRRSARARRLAIRVHLDGRVEVVVPRGVGDAVIGGFLHRHREWIARRLAERARPPAAPSFPPSSIVLPALGQTYWVHLAGGRGRARANVVGDALLVISGAQDTDSARRAVRDWLIEHARAAFEPRLRELAEHGGFRFRRLQLRRQRTRWGSCSSRGVISLNVCAVFQSPEVLDYLMIHELAHTRHMNHSPAYWREVALYCSDWRRLDRELSRGWQHVPPWIFADT